MAWESSQEQRPGWAPYQATTSRAGLPTRSVAVPRRAKVSRRRRRHPLRSRAAALALARRLRPLAPLPRVSLLPPPPPAARCSWPPCARRPRVAGPPALGGETILVSGWRTRRGGRDSAPRSQISREISGILPSAGLANFLKNFRKSTGLPQRAARKCKGLIRIKECARRTHTRV